jgi:hypothetical protein
VKGKSDHSHSNENADGKSQNNYEWKKIVGCAFQELFDKSWAQNAIIGIALFLIAPLAGFLFMKTAKGMVLGAATGVTILVWVFACLIIKNFPKPDKSDQGKQTNVITPDSKPRPAIDWVKVPEEAFLLIVGDSVMWAHNLPFTLIEQGQEQMFVLNEEAKGGMSVSAKFFNSSGKIIAEIDRNKIHPNPKSFWRTESTEHRLKILDDEAKVVVDLEFLNPNTVKILGDFFIRNGRAFSFHEDGVGTPMGKFEHFSFGESNVGFKFDR